MLLFGGWKGFGSSYRPSLGAFGGILTLWDASEIEVWVIMSFANGMIIKGCFVTCNEFFIANLYAPCDLVYLLQFQCCCDFQCR